MTINAATGKHDFHADHPPVVVHTDGGGTYQSEAWKRTCAENGVVRSMSRKGCCPDNARAEGLCA